MKALFLLLILLLAPSGALAGDILLESETESELINTIRPPKGLVRFVLNSKSARAEVHIFSRCLNEKGISRKEAEKLFSIASVPLSNRKESLYFVRPAREPYCMAFYGAHTFMYWLISGQTNNTTDKYRILYEGNSDSFVVLSSVTKGYPDIEVGASHVVEFTTSLWKYDGEKYVRTSSRTER